MNPGLLSILSTKCVSNKIGSGHLFADQYSQFLEGHWPFSFGPSFFFSASQGHAFWQF